MGVGVLSFVVAWRARCSAIENGHPAWLVYSGLTVIVFVTALSLAFLLVPITDLPRFQILRNVARITRMLAPAAIGAFIVYLASRDDSPRACRNRRRDSRSADSDMGTAESHEGIGRDV